MGLFKSIGNIINSVASPIVSGVETIVHQPLKGIGEIAGGLSAAIPNLAGSTLSELGADKIPVIGQAAIDINTAQSQAWAALGQGQLPSKDTITLGAQSAATIGAAYAGASLISSALQSGNYTSALQNGVNLLAPASPEELTSNSVGSGVKKTAVASAPVLPQDNSVLYLALIGGGAALLFFALKRK